MNTGDAEGRLKRSEWLMRPETQRLMAMLDGAQGRTRAVGGIVRDTLLDLPREAADIDLATELTPAEVIERAGRAGVSVYPTGLAHGTVTLKLDSLEPHVLVRSAIACAPECCAVSVGRRGEMRHFPANNQ